MKIALVNIHQLETSLKPALIWIRENPNTSLPGTSHDGVNRVVIELPPAKILAESNTIENTQTLNELVEPEPFEGVIKRIGRELLKGSDALILLEKHLLDQLFATAHHRIWCGNYEEVEALQADYQSAFNQSLNPSLTLPEAIRTARQTLKTWLQTP